MEVDASAKTEDGTATAPPAEVASESAETAAAEPTEEAPAPAAEVPAAEGSGDGTMEVEGGGAEAAKADEAVAAEEAPGEATKHDDQPPVKADSKPKHTFPEPTHSDTEFVTHDVNAFLRKALYEVQRCCTF